MNQGKKTHQTQSAMLTSLESLTCTMEMTRGYELDLKEEQGEVET